MCQDMIIIGELLYFGRIFEWMLHIGTSAYQWVNFGCSKWGHRPSKCLGDIGVR